MSQTQTGARTIFRINGQKVAFASDCSYNITHDHVPIDVLDKINSVEYAEVGYTCNFTCNTFRVPGMSPVEQGFMPKLEEILTQPELTAELIDRITGQTILRVVGVKLTGRSGNIGARSAGTESLSFVGLRASDEAGD